MGEREGGQRTNSSRLDHVADGETLDGLVLGGAARAVAAADGLDMAATLLVAAAASDTLAILSRDPISSGYRRGDVLRASTATGQREYRTCSFSS